MPNRYLFFLGHPAHYHLFKNIIIQLKLRGHHTKVLIRSKDILEKLCINENLEYVNVLPKVRKNNYISLFLSFIKKYFSISKIIKSYKPTMLLSSEPTFSHLGKIFNIPSIIFSEDDAEIIPLYAWITYPFTDTIISPKVCSAGKWEYKKTDYNGYHKLSYLHPSIFRPNKNLINKKLGNNYFIIRFSDLDAYHDNNKKGISKNLAIEIIKLLKNHGNIYITSEYDLDVEFKKYQINISPELIHHVLFYANLYIGDSQSMAVESALLGTPGLRFNDFAGKISVLNELEFKYGLTQSFKTNEKEKLLELIKKIIVDPNYKLNFKKKHKIMLNDKINVLNFFINFIEKYDD